MPQKGWLSVTVPGAPALWRRLRRSARRYRDIEVGQVSRAAVTCDFDYEEGARGPFIPKLNNIVIERLHARQAVRVLDSRGLSGAPVRGITMRDCSFDGVREASVLRHTEGVVLENVRVNGKVVKELT